MPFIDHCRASAVLAPCSQPDCPCGQGPAQRGEEDEEEQGEKHMGVISLLEVIGRAHSAGLLHAKICMALVSTPHLLRLAPVEAASLPTGSVASSLR